jgi:hypothetical protein
MLETDRALLARSSIPNLVMVHALPDAETC